MASKLPTPPARRRSGRALQRLHIRGRQGARRPAAETPGDAALHRRRRVRGEKNGGRAVGGTGDRLSSSFNLGADRRSTFFTDQTIYRCASTGSLGLYASRPTALVAVGSSPMRAWTSARIAINVRRPATDRDARTSKPRPPEWLRRGRRPVVANRRRSRTLLFRLNGKAGPIRQHIQICMAASCSYGFL